ncbi:hypothetical protein ONS95_002865 [Cadophora gregata]|uniref:uncharacterized protein n=1 Tax=Cadophora gregata TaxID=51156 RepID=UPI0026DAF2E3|nr:uncharacterized protein ONS95_002865 [Cadophora gregata]KAK0108040.1 hypothetical protein ONS95_002865 [Cadophora gregata]KAK0109373.1 hypothetical protein ONS96_003188 [Cadophora gregata f. sp. sojae]
MMASTASLPMSMKAQFLEAFKTPYVLRTVPLPKPSCAHDLLIKVDAASYCHTDAVLADGQMPPNPPSFPHIGCHEFAGTIVSLPPSPASDFRIGDRIGVPGRAFNPCGSCFECLDETIPDFDPAGYSVLCPNSGNNGLSRPGGFAEYAVVDARQVAPIPASMTAVETAPLMCAGVTIYSALKRCHLQPGQRVGIVGCGGGLGHLGLQFATKMGFRVIGVDSADGALTLAQDLNTGARIVDVRTVTAEQIVQELGQEDRKKEAGDKGLDAVIILPESQKAFEYGVRLLKNHGRCVVVSFPEAGFHFSARDVVFRDISIIGSLVGSNRSLREMLEFAAEHDVKAVLKTYPLSGLNDLVAEYHKGSGGKLVIDMSQEM